MPALGSPIRAMKPARVVMKWPFTIERQPLTHRAGHGQMACACRGGATYQPCCDSLTHPFGQVWNYFLTKANQTQGDDRMYKGFGAAMTLIIGGMLGLPVAMLALV